MRASEKGTSEVVQELVSAGAKQSIAGKVRSLVVVVLGFPGGIVYG
jgi:hypothetical protein